MKSIIPWVPTKAQEEAMMREINKQIAEADKKRYPETVAMVLYALHVHKGTQFGVKRLRAFFEDFDKIHKELLKRYELDNDETPWIAERLLKEIGIDVQEWCNE